MISFKQTNISIRLNLCVKMIYKRGLVILLEYEIIVIITLIKCIFSIFFAAVAFISSNTLEKKNI